MFNAYDFVFADIPASMYGLYICDFGSNSNDDNQFGNKANIVETRLPNRITPLHYGVRYNDDPLNFKLIFGSDKKLDRYELQEISRWLMGYQDYQWLSIDQPDMDHIQYRCLITSLTPISVGWIPYAFEANILCDCPYGYSYPFSNEVTVANNGTYIFYNDSTIRDNLLPDISIDIEAGCTDFSILNEATGKEMKFEGLPSGGITIIIDNENEIIRDGLDEYNLYDYFNFQFFEAVSGDNNLIITGTGTITISGRYLYTVGA